jgi:hypothetical protein
MPTKQTNKRRKGAEHPINSTVISTATGTPVPSSTSDDELLTRTRAADLLSTLWGGVPVAPRSVASWPIPYRVVGHDALYRRGDLVAHARRKLANAPVRTGGGVSAIRRLIDSPPDA